MNQTKQSTPVELDDDVEISLGANYGLTDPCTIINPQPGYRYYHAANDGDNSRPDGVARIEAEGYEKCTIEKSLSTDCIPMRIPIEKWEARQRAKLRATEAATNANMHLGGVPDESSHVVEGHGQRKRK